MCIALYIKFNISQQRFSNRKRPLRVSPHTNNKNLWASIFKPTFFTGFSAKSIFHGLLQLHHTISECMCLHHFYFCSLVLITMKYFLFSYFECTWSTKISHPQDKKKMAPICFQEVNTAWNLPGAMLSLANKWELVSKPFIQKCGYAPQEITSGNS